MPWSAGRGSHPGTSRRPSPRPFLHTDAGPVQVVRSTAALPVQHRPSSSGDHAPGPERLRAASLGNRECALPVPSESHALERSAAERAVWSMHSQTQLRIRAGLMRVGPAWTRGVLNPKAGQAQALPTGACSRPLLALAPLPFGCSARAVSCLPSRVPTPVVNLEPKPKHQS
jgi:hypothetical protein